jgi:nicotinamidase-related amidase
MTEYWNAQLYSTVADQCDPTQDVICHKERVSGLWKDRTQLSAALKRHRIKTLLFAGVNTNQCVHGTLLDAYYQGYHCILVEDCCATKAPGGQELPIIDVSVSVFFDGAGGRGR